MIRFRSYLTIYITCKMQCSCCLLTQGMMVLITVGWTNKRCTHWNWLRTLVMSLMNPICYLNFSGENGYLLKLVFIQTKMWYSKIYLLAENCYKCNILSTGYIQLLLFLLKKSENRKFQLYPIMGKSTTRYNHSSNQVWLSNCLFGV